MVIISLEFGENNGTTAGSYTTSASLSPVADTLYLIFVVAMSDTGAWTGSPTLTGGGMTWTLDTSHNAFGNRVSFFFRAVDASPGSGTLTFTAPGSEEWRGISITILKVTDSVVSGTNGEDAIIQVDTVAQDTGANVTTEVTYTNSFGAGNIGVASFALYSSGVLSTPRSGWTELYDAFASGKVSQAVHWRNDSDSAASATYASTSGVRTGIAVEIAAAAGAASLPPRRSFMHRSPHLRM